MLLLLLWLAFGQPLDPPAVSGAASPTGYDADIALLIAALDY